MKTPGVEHDDGGVGLVRRGRGAQGPQQVRAVVADRPHPLAGEQVGEDARHRAAVLHDVRHARRVAEVVLQDPEDPLLVPDEVDPRDVDAHAVGRDEPGRGPVEVLAAGDQAAGQHAVADDLGVAVDVGEEHLQRLDALHDAPLQLRPLRGADHPGHDVERDRPFLARERERDALVDVGAVQRLGAHLEVGHRRGRDRLVEGPVRRADAAVGGEHLVPGAGVGPVRGEIVVEQRRRGRAVLLRPVLLRLDCSGIVGSDGVLRGAAHGGHLPQPS